MRHAHAHLARITCAHTTHASVEHIVIPSATALPARFALTDERSRTKRRDLDMAFDAQSFVDFERRTVGADAADFALLLERERVNFAEVLAGADASTGVPQVALPFVQAFPPKLKGIKNALYDTAILGFERGYTGDEQYPAAAYDEALHRAAYAILRLALCSMADFVA